MRRNLVALLITTAVPAALPAQVMPTSVVRRGGGPGGAFEAEPISVILEFASLLDLADSQRTALMEMRRRVRAANAPHLRSLDSLRQVLSVNTEPGPRGLSEEDRRQLARFEELGRPFNDSIRVNNDAARTAARLLLDSVQVVRLDSATSTGRGGREGRRGPPPPRG